MPNGTSTAVTEATRLGEIGFPEFTAKLVKDVFDALLAATLRQMEAYSELVAATAKTLQEYVEENKQLVSGEEVWEWLVKNLPGPAASVTNPQPEDATLVRVGVKLTEDQNTKEITKIREKLNWTTQNWNPQVDNNKQYQLQEADITNITGRVREIIAGNRYTLLKEMVRMGIIRLVVDYGEIETKLTFTTYGESQQLKAASAYQSRAFGISGGVSARLKVVQASVAASYSSVSVRTTSSIDRDVSGSKVDIYGRVFIRFKSDYVALRG
jgi:tRNA/tmRNA/rRNA uracil-C5-methylase (TrmA/RlmC/RlmD family)